MVDEEAELGLAGLPASRTMEDEGEEQDIDGRGKGCLREECTGQEAESERRLEERGAPGKGRDSGNPAAAIMPAVPLMSRNLKVAAMMKRPAKIRRATRIAAVVQRGAAASRGIGGLRMGLSIDPRTDDPKQIRQF